MRKNKMSTVARTNTRPLTLDEVKNLAKSSDVTSNYNALAEAAKRMNSLAGLGRSTADALQRATGTFNALEAATRMNSLAGLGRSTADALQRATGSFNALEAATQTNSLAGLGRSTADAVQRATGTFNALEAATQTNSLAGLGRSTADAVQRATGTFNALEAATRTNLRAHPIRSSTDLGRLVKEAREGMQLSQQRFADLAGVGRRFVSELEHGKTTLEFGKVLQVCNAAGIDIHAGKK